MPHKKRLISPKRKAKRSAPVKRKPIRKYFTKNYFDFLLEQELAKKAKRSAPVKRKPKRKKSVPTLSSDEKLFDFLLERELTRKQERKKSGARIARKVTKTFKSRPGEYVFKFSPPLKNPELEFVPHLLDRIQIERWSIFREVRLRVLMHWQRKDNNEKRYKIFHYYAENFAALLEYLVFRRNDFSEQFARSSLPRDSVRETLQFEEVAIKNKVVSSYGILFSKK